MDKERTPWKCMKKGGLENKKKYGKEGMEEYKEERRKERHEV